MPNALLRSLGSVNVVVSSDSAEGTSSAANAPWQARAVISMAKLTDAPPMAETTANPARPASEAVGEGAPGDRYDRVPAIAAAVSRRRGAATPAPVRGRSGRGPGRASPILDRSRSHVRDRSVDLGHPAGTHEVRHLGEFRAAH